MLVADRTDKIFGSGITLCFKCGGLIEEETEPRTVRQRFNRRMGELVAYPYRRYGGGVFSCCCQTESSSSSSSSIDDDLPCPVCQPDDGMLVDIPDCSFTSVAGSWIALSGSGGRTSTVGSEALCNYTTSDGSRTIYVEATAPLNTQFFVRMGDCTVTVKFSQAGDGFVRIAAGASVETSPLGDTVNALATTKSLGLQICYSPVTGKVTAQVNRNGGMFAELTHTITGDNNYVGVSVLPFGELFFSNFYLAENNPDSRNCRCHPGADCQQCLNLTDDATPGVDGPFGTAPRTYKVVVSGVIDGTNALACTGCDVYNGTYYLTRVTNSYYVSGVCTWVLFDAVEGVIRYPPPTNPCTTRTMAVVMSLYGAGTNPALHTMWNVWLIAHRQLTPTTYTTPSQTLALGNVVSNGAAPDQDVGYLKCREEFTVMTSKSGTTGGFGPCNVRNSVATFTPIYD